MSNDNNDDPDDVNFSVDSDPEENQETIESKGVLSFAFDHIYAITPENTNVRGRTIVLSDNQQSSVRASQLQAEQTQQKVEKLTNSLNGTQTEVQKLKALISAHLDLIQKQSDIIATKEKQVKAYMVENDILKLRLQRCGIIEESQSAVSVSETVFTNQDLQTFSVPFTGTLISAGPSTSGQGFPGQIAELKTFDQTMPKVKISRHTSASHSSTKSYDMSGPSKTQSFGRYAEKANAYKPISASSVCTDKTAVQYGFNTLPKSSKGGKSKSSKKSTTLQFASTKPYTKSGNISSPCSRKNSVETAYIMKNYGLEKPNESLRKIETSCRDFSYGESISNIGNDILSNIERANNAANEYSSFNMWPNPDDDALFKSIDESIKEPMLSSIPPSFDVGNISNIDDSKSVKTKQDSNAIIRSMFMADVSADEPPKSSLRKKTHHNIYDCDPSDNLDLLHKKEDLPKRGTSPSASVYSFEDSQDTKVADSRKVMEPQLSVTESLNRMGKRRGRAFGVFGEPRVEDKPTASTKARKRAQSTSSRVSAVSQAESASSVLGIPDDKNLFKNKSLAPLSAVDPYYTPVGAAAQPVKQESTNNLEVPKWRIRRIRPQALSYSENEENVDDSVFNKRHGKMEIEERRIKRWDFQRLKEQLHLKKLKERQEKLNPGGKKLLYRPYKPRRVIPHSLWQSYENVLAIEITDNLPVTSFGEPIPSFKPRKFRLPWIQQQKGKKKSRRHLHVEKKTKGKDE